MTAENVLSADSIDLIGECILHEIWLLEEVIGALSFHKEEHPETFSPAREVELQQAIVKMAKLEELLPKVSSEWADNLTAWRLFLSSVEFIHIQAPFNIDDENPLDLSSGDQGGPGY